MSNQLGSLKMGQKLKKTPAGEIPVDWDVLPIKDLVLKISNGGTPDRSNGQYWEGKIPWISGADFGDQKVAVVRRYITKEAVENSATNIIPKGALLVVTRTGVGKLAVAPFDLTISQDITGLLPDAKYTSSEFLFWMLNFHIPKLKANHQGTSINGVLREDLEAFPIPVPTIAEQNKITGILSAVRALEEKANAEIEKSKTLKKGLMRQLLTRGIGHKKFKKTEAGEIPAKWRIAALSKIADVIMGQSPESSTYNQKNEGLPFYQGNADFGKVYPVPSCWCTAPKKIAREGDILISVRAPVGEINIAPHDCCIGRGLGAIRPTFADSWYLYYSLLRSSNVFNKLSQGSTFTAINGKDLAKILIPIPESSNEQKEIGQILLGLDEQNDKALQQLEGIVLLKKSLMSALLTGKVRVG